MVIDCAEAPLAAQTTSRHATKATEKGRVIAPPEAKPYYPSAPAGHRLFRSSRCDRRKRLLVSFPRRKEEHVGVFGLTIYFSNSSGQNCKWRPSPGPAPTDILNCRK